MQLLILLVPCLVSAAPQGFSPRAQAQLAAQALEDRLNSQAAAANSQPSIVSQSSSRPVGFGDASAQEIAEIRAGTYQETTGNNAEYKFRYKVADDTEQTYIAQEEQRAGNTVTGSYQYVDPLGSLIVVNYSAGPGGYQQTRQVKPNFVTIRARPVRSQVGSSSSAPRFSSRPAAGRRTVTRVISAPAVTRVIAAPATKRVISAPTVTRVIPSTTVTRIIPSPTVTRVIPALTATRVSQAPTVTRISQAPTVTRVRQAPTVTRVIPSPTVTRVLPAATAPVLVSSGSSGNLSSVSGP